MDKVKRGKSGGKNGHLFIKINIEEDNNLSLKGYNLYTNLLLSPWEAALGTKTKIKGIDDEISIIVPKGVQSGQEVVIEGKGYKDGKGSRGDLIANVKILVPKELTEVEKELFIKLSKESTFDPRRII